MGKAEGGIGNAEGGMKQREAGRPWGWRL